MTKNKFYRGSIELVFDEEKHRYSINGNQVDGVTTVLSVINKPALVSWAAGLAADYVKERLAPGVGLDEIQIKELCAEAKNAHRKRKEKAGDIGSEIHSWVERHIKGLKPPIPVNESIRNGVKAFLKWTKEMNVEFIKNEFQVYSKDFNFAGTCDFYAKVDGFYTIGDFKTSSGIYDEMFFQTAAYDIAMREEDGELPVDQYMIVNIRKDGTLETKISDELIENARAFHAALTLHRRINAMKSV